jgi:hypothetical protein
MDGERTMTIALMKSDPASSSTFANLMDQSIYAPLPDDWIIGMTDVVDSTLAIRQGRYRQVNFAGVSVIAALGNALGRFDFPFTFGGDGAAFALPVSRRTEAIQALEAVATYARTHFDLGLRAGLFPVSEIRKNGHDVRTARYAASDSAVYSMFSGGGIRWAERQLKSGSRWRIEPRQGAASPPDLTGLSCEWKPFLNRKGTILSLLVESRGAPNRAFSDLARRIIELFERDRRGSNPVPEAPPARSRVETVDAETWAVIARNSDFRKYDDILRLTVDCSLAQVNIVKDMLQAAAAREEVAYGFHCQSHAIMTCLVPSANSDAHLHFLDGMDGGYTKAAAMLRLCR